MIGGLDSSFDRPTPAQAAAAYAAGIRVWGGYLGTRGGLGLATTWDQAAFQIVKDAGMTAIGFCSGWEDPAAIRALGLAWGVLPCVDVETGIRTDGLWLDDWLPAAAAGLYGLASVHYETGRPIGRGAAFNIVADYLAVGCTGEVWPSWLQRPSGPCGWQCQGDHQEFGLSVDRSWLDDSFQGEDMTPEEHDMLSRTRDLGEAIHRLLIFGNNDGVNSGEWLWGISDGKGGSQIAALAQAVGNLSKPVVDVDALAVTLVAKLPAQATPQQIATAVRQELAAQLAKP